MAATTMPAGPQKPPAGMGLAPLSVPSAQEGRSMPSFAFPVIDLASWHTGTDAGRRAVAKRVRTACETTGFFAVVGHRVPPDTIEAMRSTSRAFRSEEHTSELQSQSNLLCR